MTFDAFHETLREAEETNNNNKKGKVKRHKKGQLKTLQANTSILFRYLLRQVKERTIQVWDKKEGPILFLEALEQQKDGGGYSSPNSVSSLFYFLFATDFQSVLIAGFPFSL